MISFGVREISIVVIPLQTNLTKILNLLTYLNFSGAGFRINSIASVVDYSFYNGNSSSWNTILRKSQS